MGLIKCPECGRDVFDTAKCCLSCGFDIKKYVREGKKQELKQKSDIKSIKQQTSLKKNNYFNYCYSSYYYCYLCRCAKTS